MLNSWVSGRDSMVTPTSLSLLDRLKVAAADASDWGRLQDIYLPLITRWLRRIPGLGGDSTTLARTHWYRQVELDYQHDLPVLTVLDLRRPEANSPALTGTYERRMPDARFTNRYNYHVVRLWREDSEAILNAGVGLVSLAPLTNVPESALPQIVRQMTDRMEGETHSRAARLGNATSLLSGLLCSGERIDSLLAGFQTMLESTTHEWLTFPDAGCHVRISSSSSPSGAIDGSPARRPSV